MKMKTLNLSKDTFDRDSEFSIDLGKKYPKTAKLYQGYQNDDSIYWALQKSGILKGEYSQADIDHRNRLNSETPVKHGDIVQIDNNQYKVRILGDFSDCAIFDPI
jgi:hypothetical protein